MTTATQRAAKILGRAGGRSKSERKQQAARENGKKGGRPKSPGKIIPETGESHDARQLNQSI